MMARLSGILGEIARSVAPVMIVKKGGANDVVAAAKTAGATGAPISFARGMSIHPPAPFLGLQPTQEQALLHLPVP